MQYVGWTSIHNFPKWQIMLTKVIILFTISVGREGVNIDYYNSLLLLSLFMVEGGLRGYSAKFNAPPTCFIWVKVDWENPSWRTAKFLLQILGTDYTPASSIQLFMTFQRTRYILWPLYKVLPVESLSVHFYENGKHFSLVTLDIASTV